MYQIKSQCIQFEDTEDFVTYFKVFKRARFFGFLYHVGDYKHIDSAIRWMNSQPREETEKNGV